MGELDFDLDRLLRAARAGGEERSSIEPPFGFATRVVALWKSQSLDGSNDSLEFARWLRTIGFAALAVTVFSGAGAWWQIDQNNEFAQPVTSAYAIADSAIERGALR